MLKSRHETVLDIMHPGMDGFAVCSKIRETSNTHILIASARVKRAITYIQPLQRFVLYNGFFRFLDFDIFGYICQMIIAEQ